MPLVSVSPETFPAGSGAGTCGVRIAVSSDIRGAAPPGPPGPEAAGGRGLPVRPASLSRSGVSDEIPVTGPVVGPDGAWARPPGAAAPGPSAPNASRELRSGPEVPPSGRNGRSARGGTWAEPEPPWAAGPPEAEPAPGPEPKPAPDPVPEPGPKDGPGPGPGAPDSPPPPEAAAGATGLRGANQSLAGFPAGAASPSWPSSRARGPGMPRSSPSGASPSAGAGASGRGVPPVRSASGRPPEASVSLIGVRMTTGGIGREPGMLIRIRVVSVVSVLGSSGRGGSAGSGASPGPPSDGCSDGYWRDPYGGVPEGYAAPPRPWGPEDELSVSRLKAGSPDWLRRPYFPHAAGQGTARRGDHLTGRRRRTLRSPG